MTITPYLPLSIDPSFKPANIATNRAAVEYNGFKFPPALKATARIRPVMDNSGRISKYVKIELKVSCYIFHGLNLGSSGTAAAPSGDGLYSGGYNAGQNTPASGNGITDYIYTTDQEMDNIKARLSEPCQALYFTSQGLGSFGVNQQATSGGLVDNANLDVDNGPKPTIVTWRPLGNKCCYIEWEVTTCMSPCRADIRRYAQFPFSVTHGISKSGLTTRTIQGEVEIALTRIPDNTTAHAGLSYAFYLSDAQQFVYQYFPMLAGYTREQNWNMSEDRKHAHFTLTDSEIDSDEAFGEGCIDEEVSLSTNNKYPMVFSIWDVNLAGSIELAAGFPKRFALAEISRLFHRYYSQCAFLGDFIVRDSSLPSAEGDADTEDDKGATQTTLAKITGGSYPILQSIHFTDHLFSRKVDFAINWSLYTTLQTLFAATGMFVPARNYSPTATGSSYYDNPDLVQRNFWGLWQYSLGIFQNAGGFQSLEFNHNQDVIISLCNDDYRGPQNPQDLNTEGDPIGSEERDSDSRDPKNAWHDFKVRFEIERKEHSRPHAPLNKTTAPTEHASSPGVARESYDFVPNIPNGGDNQAALTVVHAQRDPSYILHFSGYAVRLNVPVPEPNVVSYGTDSNGVPIPVTRIGTSTLRPQYIGTGTDLTTGKSYKIYGLAWHKMYSLPTAPLSSKIVTDGHMDIFMNG